MQVLRNKVYAILSVATEGHEGIGANYCASVSGATLAHHALRNKHAINPPISLDDVIRDCEFLYEVFYVTEFENIWTGDRWRGSPDGMRQAYLRIPDVYEELRIRCTSAHSVYLGGTQSILTVTCWNRSAAGILYQHIRAYL